MAKTDSNKPVKPYSKPTLTIYGKVQELTQAVGNMGQMDGGAVVGRMMTAV
jgi:hypothetical protein